MPDRVRSVVMVTSAEENSPCWMARPMRSENLRISRKPQAKRSRGGWWLSGKLLQSPAKLHEKIRESHVSPGLDTGNQPLSGAGSPDDLEITQGFPPMFVAPG